MTDISLQARINAVRTICKSLGISAHDLLSESCPPSMTMHDYCSSWVPEEGELYWFPLDGRPEGDDFWPRDEHLRRAEVGVCFRTQEACQASIDAAKRLPIICMEIVSTGAASAEHRREMADLLYALMGGDDHNLQGGRR